MERQAAGAKRFFEIDFARGAAVIMMVSFNWLFALYYLGLLPSFNPNDVFWWFFARATAGSFIFLAGLSLYLGSEKVESRQKLLFRGAKIFALGMAITAATALFLKSGFIVFGILHAIGVSIILAVPLLKRDAKTIAFVGVACLASGVFISNCSFSFPWLLWLGFVPKGFHTLDFFPILPWFGVMLLGIAVGKTFYPQAQRSFKPLLNENFFTKPLAFLGRHSLAIYLAHQPLLIAVLYFSGVPLQGLNI